MHIVFLSDTMKFSGGRKTLFEYAKYLRGKPEHKVDVLIQRKEGELKNFIDVKVVPDYSPDNIPGCDVIVATTPREVKNACDSGKGIAVHFCQGFEITDLEQRIKGEVVPLRYNKRNILSSFFLFRKKFSWKRKIKNIDKIYGNPISYIITVSPHLQKQLRERYKKEIFLVRNGVDNNYFYPPEKKSSRDKMKEEPLKVINVGPADVTFKGIEVTMKAVMKAKKEGMPISFTRVTPKILPEEKNNSLIDNLYENISPEELGNLFREHDVYISNSTEGEGFGLPAMEALSCGMICILSNISAYKSFGPHDKNYCLFVPPNNVDETFNILKFVYGMSEEEKKQVTANALDVSKDYTKEKACIEFEAALQEILGENTETKRIPFPY